MGWGAPFLQALSSAGPYAPLFTVRRVKHFAEPGNAFEASSSPGLATAYRVGELRVEGQNIVPRSWSPTIGAFSVEIVGDPTDALLSLPRGSIIEVMCSLGGSEGRIAVGQVRTLRGSAPRIQIECLDLFSALRSPLDSTAGAPFSSVSASTTTTALAASGAATYTVASTTGFARQTGGLGAFLVTPASGDPYYRIWNASTATTFTIEDPSDAQEMGTTDIGCLVGAGIAEIAYLYGHPFDIARKILTSTGAGTNGAYDLYPQDWGLGVLADYVDDSDIEAWEAYVAVASGAYTIQIPIDAETGAAVTDPLDWLIGILSPFGIWPTVRQGSITLRAVQGTHLTTGVRYATDASGGTFTVALAEVVAVLDYDAWSPDHPHEYETTTVQTASTSRSISDGASASLPGGGSLTHDLSATVFENESAISADVAARVFEADVRIPERLRLRLRGMRAAVLCPGDVIVLDLATGGPTEIVYCRDGGSFVGRAAMVHEMSPDWMGGVVDLGLWVYPDLSTTPSGSSEVA